MEYYNQNGIRVRTSIRSDVDFLKDNLKKADIDEIWASHNHTAEEALNYSVEHSIFCCTVVNGRPIAIFGINAERITDKKACIWFLSTDQIYKIKMRFLKNCKEYIDRMLEYYPYLENYVDARNEVTVKWLKFCGATIEDAKPYGVERLPFHHFYFERK